MIIDMICPICGREFDSTRGFNIHVRIKHGGIELPRYKLSNKQRQLDEKHNLSARSDLNIVKLYAAELRSATSREELRELEVPRGVITKLYTFGIIRVTGAHRDRRLELTDYGKQLVNDCSTDD